jgi:hypothetical protein
MYSAGTSVDPSERIKSVTQPRYFATSETVKKLDGGLAAIVCLKAVDALDMIVQFTLIACRAILRYGERRGGSFDRKILPYVGAIKQSTYALPGLHCRLFARTDGHIGLALEGHR